MIYTLREFAKKEGINVRTVQHRIQKNQLPTNHFVKKGGREYMIQVCSVHEYKAGEYFDACVEFHKRKESFSRPIELCAELSVKYDILLTKLCKILGV
jgi:hypothetical protein